MYIPLIIIIYIYIQKAIQFAVYDPNFNYDENVTDDIAEANEDIGNTNYDNDDDDDDEDEYEYESDNGEEDDTWQIRSNAIKVLIACINKEIIPLEKLVEKLGRLLIVRFQDRSENVKLEMIRCGSLLLQKIISLSENSPNKFSKDISSFLDMTVSRICIYHIIYYFIFFFFFSFSFYIYYSLFLFFPFSFYIYLS